MTFSRVTVIAVTAALVLAGVAGCASQPGPAGSRPTSSGGSGSVDLDLPRIPWEGGPDYWAQYANAEKWTDPSFFPIGIWFNEIENDDEVAWDKDHGINFYAGMWEGTDFSLFERNDVYWIGPKLNESFDESSLNWPGVLLDDEVDGRFPPEEGLQRLRDAQDQVPSSQFSYANYSQMVIGPDLDLQAQKDYVNLPDVVSLDMYWYTIPFCDWTPYRGDGYAVPVPQETCRTAASYGRAMSSLTERDLTDGVLHPRWMFVENLNGMSGEHVRYIEPAELKGAAMSSVINEARGLIWFNQSLTGPCHTGRALRTAQREGESFCGKPQMDAMGEVNRLIQSLAPVLNTQSYEWDFGSDLDTMLKSHDGAAYIFAMPDGTDGRRTFKLPPGISGSTAEVIGEDREIAIKNGSFADEFSDEYAYHIYKVQI